MRLSRALAVRPLVLLVVGAGTLLLAGLPVAAGQETEEPAPSLHEEQALALLGQAAQAARTRTWAGTQYVATWRNGTVSARVLQVRHEPGTGTLVEGEPSEDSASRGTSTDDGATDNASDDSATAASPGTPATALDEHLLGQLAARYALSVSGAGTCSGRRAVVVEARRTDGRVAGRFWLDRETALPLRREVWDAQGRQLRSSAFVELQVAPATGTPEVQAVRTAVQAAPTGAAGGSGWVAPDELPGGYALYGAARPVHDGTAVLHLAYSDGLSTVSLFSQPGSLGDTPGAGFRAQRVGRTTVWVHSGTPERVVWGGDGTVFTLVSDAAHADLLAAVRALPHDAAPDDGPSARFGRGLARVGSWLDPRS